MEDIHASIRYGFTNMTDALEMTKAPMKERVNSLPLLAPATSTSLKTTAKSDEWRPPVQRHVDRAGTFLFSSLRVRILNGDVERNYSIQFKETALRVSDVCAGIARKEGIPDGKAVFFRLWIIGKDLELQLNDQQSIDDIISEWPHRMLQYAHFPESKNPRHPINRYWFVYRHKAGLSISEQGQIVSNEASLSLLFAEVKRNVLTNRYLFLDPEFLIQLGALQLQILYGDYQISTGAELLLKQQVFETILPIETPISPSIISKIVSAYEALNGMTELDARKRFIQISQSSPMFSSSFFPVCEERPPLGYFEYRVQKWFIAVGFQGLTLFDSKKKKIFSAYSWSDIDWTYNEMEFKIKCLCNNSKSFHLLSPQSPLIDQLAKRSKLKWRNESVRGVQSLSEPFENVIPAITEPAKRKTRLINTRVRPGKQRNVGGKPSLTNRLKAMFSNSTAKVKKPANSIFDLDRGLEGLGSERRLHWIQ